MQGKQELRKRDYKNFFEMVGKEIYSILRVCIYFTIDKKIYTGIGRLHNCLWGFVGSVNKKEGKLITLEMINKFCQNRSLPVQILNIPESETQFKIKIIR